MKVFTLLNQKGGTGKTSSAVNIAAGLSLCGLKCLLVDIDPQGNLSESVGIKALGEKEITTYEVLAGEDINKAIRPATEGRYDVLPADIRLSAAEIELVNADRRNYRLKDAIDGLRANYDFVIIDSPPSLSILTVMALTASDEVIIPVQAQYLPLSGVAQLRDTIELIKARFNPKLEIGGILLTFFNERRNLDREVLEVLDQAFKGKVFKTKISQSTMIAEAPSYGKDVISYSPNCKGAQQYKQLAREILEHETTERKV